MAFETQRLTFPAAATGHAARRAALFRESLPAMAERWTLGLAWALAPGRISGLPNLIRMCFEEALAPDYALPDPERALASPPGLAGIVHELSLPILLAAYRRGLYPLAHIAPLKWWSPPQRSVLHFRNFHISNNLARLMRQDRYSVTFDRDFDGVIAACAGRREGRWHLTWITPRIMRVYAEASTPATRIRSKSGTRPANWSPAAMVSPSGRASRRSCSSRTSRMPRASA